MNHLALNCLFNLTSLAKNETEKERDNLKIPIRFQIVIHYSGEKENWASKT